MKEPFETSTQNARYRRFRSRRSPWPLFSALALITFLVGAAAFLSPDRINPIERASMEETASDGASTGDERDENSGGAEPEGAGSGNEERNEESSSATSESAEPGNAAASEERASSEAESAGSEGSENAAEPESPEREASEQEASAQEDSRQGSEREAAGQSSDGEGSGEQAEERQAEEQDTSPPPPANKDMGLTVPRLGIQGDSVTNSADPQVLHEGAQKLPSTGFPWQDGANTYIAGHRIGFPGTESHNQFYNLPAMREGDPVYLTDANGETYEYRVTEIFAVSPSESWVTEPVAGRDMVTLQTCTHSPDDWWSITPQLFEAGPETGRLVVRADRV